MGWIKRMLGSETSESNGDENEATLARMAADGDDLTKSRDIDFTHLFSSEEDTKAFIEAAMSKGYGRSSHEFWKERVSWLSSIQVKIVPTLQEITATEDELNQIAAEFGGTPDGWGCMEVVPPGQS